MTEQDIRVGLLNSLLTTPHGKLEQDGQTHLNIVDRDPIFYAHLAMWYKKNGSVRDHNILFSAFLTTSQVEDMQRIHRGTGAYLTRQLPPYQVAREIRFIKEGLERNVPRSLKFNVEIYLDILEQNENRFDGAVLSSRNDLKYLYSTLHIKPGTRAQAILFDDNPPEGSKPWALKQAAAQDSDLEKARLIVEYNLPWTVATSIISPKNPLGLTALVNAMTPSQVINNLSSIKKSGGMDNPDIRKIVDEKLKAARKDKNVSAYKAKVASVAANVDEEAEELLEEVREQQIKSKGTIARDTAILIDISGSLMEAIEVSKQLAPMVANICTGHLYVIAFNTAVYPVPIPEEMSLAGMEKAMHGLRAMGGTCIGGPLIYMAKNGINVEQFIIITDEDENNNPSFYDAYLQYTRNMTDSPSVTIVRVGPYKTDAIQNSCKRLGIEYNAFDFNGDYYSLPNVIPFLTGKSRFDLVMEIMATPLPV